MSAPARRQVEVILGPRLGGTMVPPDLAERGWELRFATMLSRPARVTRALVALLVGIYLVSDTLSVRLLLGGARNLAGADTVLLSALGAKVDNLVAQGEWWRLGSSIFLHAGILHLLANALALHYLGRLVENALGPAALLILFALGGIAGSWCSYLLVDTPSVGASGAIFALLGAAAAHGLIHRRRVPRRLRRFLVIAPLVWIALNLAAAFLSAHVDVAAHAAGLAMGLVLAPLLGDRILRRLPILPAPLRAALLLTSLLFLAVALGALAPRLLGSIPPASDDLRVVVVGAVERDGGHAPEPRALRGPAHWQVQRVAIAACAPDMRRYAGRKHGRARRVVAFRDDYGALLCVLEPGFIHPEELRILGGQPSRTPENAYLVPADRRGDRAVYRRRVVPGDPFVRLMTRAPGGPIYLLRTFAPLESAYQPLMRRLARALPAP